MWHTFSSCIFLAGPLTGPTSQAYQAAGAPAAHEVCATIKFLLLLLLFCPC
jgi:hypothetical protein